MLLALLREMEPSAIPFLGFFLGLSLFLLALFLACKSRAATSTASTPATCDSPAATSTTPTLRAEAPLWRPQPPRGLLAIGPGADKLGAPAAAAAVQSPAAADKPRTRYATNRDNHFLTPPAPPCSVRERAHALCMPDPDVADSHLRRREPPCDVISVEPAARKEGAVAFTTHPCATALSVARAAELEAEMAALIRAEVAALAATSGADKLGARYEPPETASEAAAEAAIVKAAAEAAAEATPEAATEAEAEAETEAAWETAVARGTILSWEAAEPTEKPAEAVFEEAIRSYKDELDAFRSTMCTMNALHSRAQ